MELTVDLTAMTDELPLPTLRMLDLARALARDPQLLMLDEITAALPSDLAEKVFAVMREWRERGRSVLFITHRLAEVTATCDRASVLRDGRTVGTLVPQRGSGGEDRRADARRDPLQARGGDRGGDLHRRGRSRRPAVGPDGRGR